MIEELINKVDNSELVRDQIAGILAGEVTSQKALAVTAGEDPTLWDFSVYLERTNPWDIFRDELDPRPLLSVSYDGGSYDKGNSNISERQAQAGRFHVDCYAKATSQAEGSGHSLGDQQATLAAQRAVRFVRNVLMSAHYCYLGLRGVVWQRWVGSVNKLEFPPEIRLADHVSVFRVTLEVQFNEFSPQFSLEELDELTIDISRKEDGEVLVEANFDYS